MFSFGQLSIDVIVSFGELSIAGALPDAIPDGRKVIELSYKS